jgi:phosphoribosylpyrophosphate synthetase
MKSFKEFTEAINIVDGHLVLDSESGISSNFGSNKKLKPYQKKIRDDLMAYSLYSANSRSDISKALKQAKIDENMQQFLTRSAIYAARVLRSFNIDIIVSPKSSSPITKLFAQELQKRTNYDFYIDSFTKAIDMNQITVDKDHPAITEKLIKSLETTLERNRKKGFISVKNFQVKDRKFIKNIFDLVDPRLEKKVGEKNVLILDDIVSSGSTSEDIYRILKTHGANETTVLTLFKS